MTISCDTMILMREGDMGDYLKKMENDFLDQALDANPSLAIPGDCRLESRVSIMKAKAARRIYTMNSIEYTQPQMMEKIIEWMTDARNPLSLPDIASLSGAPTLREIFAWRRDFPTFNEEMTDAEKIRGLLLAEKSVKVSLDESDPKAGSLTKAKAESLRWMASKLDPHKFADRKVEDRMDPFKDASTKQMLDALREAIKSNKELIKSLSDKEIQEFKEMGVIDVDPEVADV